MRALSLPVMLLAIALLWCVAAIAVQGWMVLLYPAGWLAVAALFLVLNKVYDAMHGKAEVRSEKSEV